MASPALHLLVPAPRPVPVDDAEAVLAGLYAHEPAVLRANMVSAVDGAAWGATHRSADINDDADFRVFRVLRALADVVLVGAWTARAERYDQVARPEDLTHLAPSDAPLRLAIVTRTGVLPPSASSASPSAPSSSTRTSSARSASSRPSRRSPRSSSCASTSSSSTTPATP